MPSNNGICKSISGGLSAMQCCVILFTWLGAFSLLWDSAIAACGVPPNIDKADILSQSATDVRYKCKSGYEPGATKTMATCQGSNWVFAENRPLVCRRVSCGTPPDKQHASYKERSYLFSDNVYYVCDTGYKQVLGTPNYNVISCQPNGRWTVISFSCGPKTCPALSNPANGNVAIVQGATNEYNYGNIYRFTCNVGFMSKGRQTVDVTCTDAATWSEKDVKCEEGICPEPTTPENGIKLNAGNKYGDLREFKCKDKYEMVGQPKNTLTSVCQKDGKWSDPPPTCRLIAVPCNVPSGPKNGYAERVNDNEYRMKCNPGYKLQSGNSYEIVTCQIDGTWSFNPAVCLVVSCGAPKIPTNGELVTNDDKKYTVRCKNGFKLVGGQVGETVSETCQNNGEWTQNNHPVCEGVTCGSPIIPNNGELVTTDTKTYTIRCKDGFRLEGGTDKITVLCQNNGQWTPVNAVCTEVTCGSPIIPNNGELVTTDTKTYTIRCKDGFRLEGGTDKITVLCQNNGQWTPVNAVCTEVTCGSPIIPNNGELVTTDTKTYTIRCKDGFRLEGVTDKITVLCQNNGQWTPVNAVCTKVTCGSPIIPNNGELVTTDTKTYTIRCKDGFRLEGGTDKITVLCQNNGQWTPVNAVCTEVTCGSPIIPNNGELVTTDTKTYTIRCKDGFRLEGGTDKITVLCQNNGQWTPVNAVCTEVTCGSPIIPNNGELVTTDTKTYTIRCKDGFRLEGGTDKITVLCQNNGQWTPVNAVCTEVTCGSPIIPNNGELVTTDTKTYTIRCKDGFRLEGVTDKITVLCQNNGQWTPVNAVCTEVTCGSPIIPNNGELVTTDTKTYTIRCKDGFRLEGGTDKITVLCQNNGQWTPVNAVCTEVTCGSPIIPNNGELVTTDTKTYTIRCKDGFRHEGVTDNITVLCQNNGQWTPKVNAVCTEETCDENPTAPANGKIDKVMKPETYKITCNKGYKIIGRDTVTCVNRLWSPTTTTCKKDCSGPPPAPLNGLVIKLKEQEYIIQCKEGYQLLGQTHDVTVTVQCENSIWTDSYTIICKGRYCTVSCCTCNGKECCTCNKKPVEIEKDLTERKPFHTEETNTNTGTTSNSNC